MLAEGHKGENMSLPKFEGCTLKNLNDDHLTPSQLSRYREQFLCFNKLKPINDTRNSVASAFVNFINSNMNQYVPGLFNQIR